MSVAQKKSANSLAFCGIACANCPAYVASRDGSCLEREELAREWSTSAYPLSAEDIYCEGCKSKDDLVMMFCLDCDVRQCAKSHKVDTCADCPAFPCSHLDPVFAKVPEACETLQALRTSL